MCGIVGAVAERNVIPILLEGLKRLEYRGYDSAGIAFVQDQHLQRIRSVGKVDALKQKVAESAPRSSVGIAHTRWATHGAPSEQNAHPHASQDEIAVVHNGIIENFAELKEELLAQGVAFESETDTEVIAHLLRQAFAESGDMRIAVQTTVAKLHGAYGLAVLNIAHPNEIFAVRSGSPLVIGLGFGENFLASDSLSLLPVTHQFIYLEEGDIAHIERDSIAIWDKEGHSAHREMVEFSGNADAASKGQYKHYMLKEIFEQPEAINQTMLPYLSEVHHPEGWGRASELLKEAQHVRIVACGTSYHAGMVAKYWFEALAGVSCDVEIASEFRYRKVVVPQKSVLVTVSQSGETADTLAALRQAKEENNYLGSLCICNVPNSSLVRESDIAFLTHAGAELGVASTKAFTTQLVAFLLLIRSLLMVRNQTTQADQVLQELKHLPELSKQVLVLDEQIKSMAGDFIEKNHALFLGRGEMFPIALEGALKLKEISYIHAEAYAAGELKHGPLALVDEEMPIVVVAPNNELLGKLQANLKEVQARGGQVYVFADESCAQSITDTKCCVTLPKLSSFLAPIVYTIPLQLLAYHVAVFKGTDVDQPRNLAKSVTVE